MLGEHADKKRPSMTWEQTMSLQNLLMMENNSTSGNKEIVEVGAAKRLSGEIQSEHLLKQIVVCYH